MKPYGQDKGDTRICRYGCCTSKCHKDRNGVEIMNRANRKTARQEAKRATSSVEIESNKENEDAS